MFNVLASGQTVFLKHMNIFLKRVSKVSRGTKEISNRKAEAKGQSFVE